MCVEWAMWERKEVVTRNRQLNHRKISIVLLKNQQLNSTMMEDQLIGKDPDIQKN